MDNVEFAGAALAKAGASDHRLLYATPELLAPLHLSGTPRITLRLASSKPAANLSVWLVVLPWTDGPIGPANYSGALAAAQASPSLPMASTGQPSRASMQRETSSSVVGCLCTYE